MKEVIITAEALPTSATKEMLNLRLSLCGSLGDIAHSVLAFHVAAMRDLNLQTYG